MRIRPKLCTLKQPCTRFGNHPHTHTRNLCIKMLGTEFAFVSPDTNKSMPKVSPNMVSIKQRSSCRIRNDSPTPWTSGEFPFRSLLSRRPLRPYQSPCASISADGGYFRSPCRALQPEDSGCTSSYTGMRCAVSYAVAFSPSTGCSAKNSKHPAGRSSVNFSTVY